MLSIIRGSILDIDVQAIVNPANEELITGGGVDRLITKTAGDLMEQAKRAIGKCPTGKAVHTSGFTLKAKYVIHTTAPRYYVLKPYETPKEELLASCYRNALDLAHSLQVESIAFPSLGTGAYNWPHTDAAHVAVSTIYKWLEQTGSNMKVFIVLLNDEHVYAYSQVSSMISDSRA